MKESSKLVEPIFKMRHHYIFSQELSGYRSMIEHSKDQIVDSLKYVYELACGATAVGTGINCPEGFDEIVTKIISEKTNLPFIPDSNKFHALTSKDAMVYTSGALKRTCG